MFLISDGGKDLGVTFWSLMRGLHFGLVVKKHWYEIEIHNVKLFEGYFY